MLSADSTERNYSLFYLAFVLFCMPFSSNAQVSATTADVPAPVATDASQAFPVATFPYPDSGVRIGQGWDSFLERGTAASCVEVAEVHLEQDSFQTSVEQIQSSFELATRSTTSVSASFGGMGGGASASFSTSKSRKINSDDQNFLFSFESASGSTFAVAPDSVGTEHTSPSEPSIKALNALKGENSQQSFIATLASRPPKIDDGLIKLTKRASELLKNSSEFRRVCGDGYVATIHRGVSIQLLLTQKYHSREEAESLSAALSASGYGASGNATYKTSTKKLTSTNSLNYRVFQEGGIPFKPVPLADPSAGKFFDVNTILPQSDYLVANPRAIRVVIVPYVNLAGFPQNSELNSTPNNLLALGDYYLALKDIYNLAGDILNSLRTAPDNTTAFDPKMVALFGGETALQDVYDRMHFDLAFLEIAIAKCFEERKLCAPADAFKYVKQHLKNQLVAVAIPLAEAEGLITELTAKKDEQSQLEASEQQRIAKRYRVYTDSVNEMLSLISDEGEIDIQFFLRFYEYLSQIPLPRVAYEGASFAKMRELKLVEDPKDKEAERKLKREKYLGGVRTDLNRSIFSYRATPWKEFFCRKLIHSQLCIPDMILQEIIETYRPVVAEGNLSITLKKTKTKKKNSFSPYLRPERGPCIGNTFNCI